MTSRTWAVQFWGCDFNVGVMAGVLCSKVGDTLHIWDEVSVKNTNTDEVCQMLRQKYPGREIVAIPTPLAFSVGPQQLERQTTASSGNTGCGWFRPRPRGA